MKHIKHQFNDNSLILEQIEPVILISNEVISSFYFIFQIRQYFKGKEKKKKMDSGFGSPDQAYFLIP